jgi:hypothetical protein
MAFHQPYSGPDCISGRVAAVNDKGLKLEGHESWLNISKFAVGCILPERGQDVTVTLDKAGFLRAVEPLTGAHAALQPTRIAGGSDAPAPSVKDRTITRLAILKAAAEFGAARPKLKSGDVLAIAASWERWVNREGADWSDVVDTLTTREAYDDDPE